MCGITGIISFTPHPAFSRVVEEMTEALIHRGPDQGAMGSLANDRYFFGVRRLKIIDLEGSDQPISSQDGRYMMIFNGEIYNHLEIRGMLKAHKVKFSTSGDGEAVLQLFKVFGKAGLKYLRGMFAIALWDKQEETLIIARDRMGEKPLYIYEKDDVFAFSSELRSICCASFVSDNIDPAAINSYFHSNYIPEPLTPLQDVAKLPAGHLIEINLKTRTRHKEKYWSMANAVAPPLRGQALVDTAPDAIRTKAHLAVQHSLRADKGIAISLSGGIDSSAVACIAAKYSNDITAISVGFEGGNEIRTTPDERGEAAALAKHLGIRFEPINISGADLEKNFESLIASCDDPVADISSFGYAEIPRKAKALDRPVLLYGHGGDELFCGYDWLQKAIKIEAKYEKQNLEALNSNRPPYLGQETFAEIDKNIPHRVIANLELALDFIDSEKNLDAMLTAEFKANLEACSHYSNPRWPSLKTGMRLNPYLSNSMIVCATYLRSNNIVQADRFSMHKSVEARLPWLDHNFVETVCGFMKAWPTNHDFTKTLWRQALEKDVPEFVLKRKKSPFRPPTSRWFKMLSQTYGPLLKGGELSKRGILTDEALDILASRTSEAKVTMPMFFRAIVLEVWLRSLPKTKTVK